MTAATRAAGRAGSTSVEDARDAHDRPPWAGSWSPVWARRAHPALSAQAPPGTLRWVDRRERETEMSWQTPGKEPPPDPAAPEPDAETTRVPLQPAPPEPATEPPSEARPRHRPPRRPVRRPRRADLRGTRRLGRPGDARGGPGDGPAVPWAPPVQAAATPGHRGPRHLRGLQPARGLRDRHRVPPAAQPGRPRSGRRARRRSRSDGDARRGRPVRRRRLPVLRRAVDQRLARDAGHAPDAVADPGCGQRHHAVDQRRAACAGSP